jgi:hypothetical protein
MHDVKIRPAILIANSGNETALPRLLFGHNDRSVSAGGKRDRESP